MKFNVFFLLRGPSGHTTEAPNNTNPVDHESLATVLAELSSKLPQFPFGVEVVGVRVERKEEQNV